VPGLARGYVVRSVSGGNEIGSCGHHDVQLAIQGSWTGITAQMVRSDWTQCSHGQQARRAGLRQPMCAIQLAGSGWLGAGRDAIMQTVLQSGSFPEWPVSPGLSSRTASHRTGVCVAGNGLACRRANLYVKDGDPRVAPWSLWTLNPLLQLCSRARMHSAEACLPPVLV
jgi:hypothetical protein